MDHYHPLVQKENKLTQQAMENAREIYFYVLSLAIIKKHNH